MIIELHPSRIMLLLCTSCHVLAALTPWFINVPFWLSGFLFPALLLSLIYHISKIQLVLSDSIIGLELLGEDCRPLFRNSDLIVHLQGEAWCSSLIQIMYFNIENEFPRQLRSNWMYRLPGAIIDRTSRRSIALIICLDSCTTEQQRQLRKFLRWRVVC